MLHKMTVAVAGSLAWAMVSAGAGVAQVDYAQDSFTDGVAGSVNGANSAYELYGTGYRQVGSQLVVGISSNLPFGGASAQGGLNGTISWGDMFFNFAPEQDFTSALTSGQVYGVRFAEANDSSVALGVYQVDAVSSVTGVNSGFNSLSAYRNNAGTVNPTLGDVYLLDDAFDYLPQTESNNMISSTSGGTLGDVEVLDAAALTSYGFDFDSNLDQTGSQTYGFKFDISKLPGGRFIAHLWAECFNEGTAFEGEIASVPEPTSALALAVVGGVAWARKRKASNA